MTPQMRSYIEYLIQTHNIIVLILKSKFMEKCSLIYSFEYDLIMILDSGLHFGATHTQADVG